MHAQRAITYLVETAMALLTMACTYHTLEVPGCSSHPPLSLVQVQHNTDCHHPIGAIHVYWDNQSGPVKYRLNNQTDQSHGTFTNLSAGGHVVIATDRKGCSDTLMIAVNNFESDLQATALTTPDNLCLGENGTATVDIIGGVPPYRYTFRNASTDSPPPLINLGAGTHSILVEDALHCRFEFTFVVERAQTGVSWQQDIKPVVTTRCAKSGCHVEGTGRIDFTVFDNVKSYASAIKSKTQNRSMPFDSALEPDLIQLIACWVDDGAPFN